MLLSISAILAWSRAGLRAVSVFPVIEGTEPDSSTNRLTVSGQSFGTVAPTVTFESMPLSIISCTNTMVVAQLPDGLAPGTYFLVQTNKSKGLPVS
jgi:hypothetical protein